MGNNGSCATVQRDCPACSISQGNKPASVAAAAASSSMPKPPHRLASSQHTDPPREVLDLAPGHSSLTQVNEPLRGAAQPAQAEDPKGVASARCQIEQDWAIEVAKAARAAVEGDQGNESAATPAQEAMAPGGKPRMSPGMIEALRSPAAGGAEQTEEEPEPAPEGNPEAEAPECDYVLERRRAIWAACVVVVIWAFIFGLILYLEGDFIEPVCPTAEEARAVNPEYEEPLVCQKCGASGPLVLPLFREFENTWNQAIRGVLYFVGLFWVFLGVGIVCDQFMAGIEEITSYERIVWVEVHKGAKHKFHVKAWNSTVANLTLMALGSSAPEILLSVIEIITNDYFAGALGASTIVGSAAFNLLMITAVCIVALPPPETRKIAAVGVFGITATVSICAYAWLVVILSLISPSKVDLWEALVTLCMFPVLVYVSFLADIGRCRCGKRKSPESQAQNQATAMQEKYGKQLPDEALKLLLGQEDDLAKHKGQSRAKLRSTVMKRITSSSRPGAAHVGKEGLHFGFQERAHVVLECAGVYELKVVASHEPGCTVHMQYRTVDGSAREGLRYGRTEGVLVFGPNMTEKTIKVPIIDNDVWEPDEDFAVELFDLQVQNGFGGHHVEASFHISIANITILNDDIPGTLGFAVDEVYTREGDVVTVGVTRTNGATGEVSCKFATVEDSAIADKDFTSVSGTLKFADGEVYRTIEVPILRTKAHELENDEVFKVVLTDAAQGAKFDKDRDGGENSAICEVVIVSNRGRSCVQRWCAACVNRDKIREFFEVWRGQFVSALYCNGSPEEQATASLSDWFFHAVCLFWKFLFCFVPPPNIYGGWLCFSCALAFIGMVTLVVGELANLLGCVWDVPGDITAITLVALGTSLPDTFASKVAAQQDATADNAVGNITGSNAVNVFLGLGLPWTIAAVYWETLGPTDEWKNHRFKGETYLAMYSGDYPNGGFMVPSDSLVFSVIVFTICALVCMALLAFRRHCYGGELGGPRCAQSRDSFILICLWVLYITCSIVNSISKT